VSLLYLDPLSYKSFVSKWPQYVAPPPPTLGLALFLPRPIGIMFQEGPAEASIPSRKGYFQHFFSAGVHSNFSMASRNK